jgi:exosortase
MTERTVSEELQRLLPKPAVLAAWFVAAAAFVWFYWSSITHLVGAWWTQDAYVHGFVVPIFALVLLWLRRDMITSSTERGSWWGLPVLALWAMIRWASVYFNYGSLPEYSMLVFFAGMAIFVGGWTGLRWSWPSIVFLFFMVPLPGAVQGAFSLALQGIAARMSVFVIQTLGLPAMAIGHKIQVGEASQPLDVAAACSGLKMLMLFFAMCVGMAFVVRRPLWEKIVLVASAAPIAVISNVIRIVSVALICEFARRWPALISFEDPQKSIDFWVGIFVMMPAGLLLLWAEMALMSKLMLAPLPERPLVVGRFQP